MKQVNKEDKINLRALNGGREKIRSAALEGQHKAQEMGGEAKKRQGNPTTERVARVSTSVETKDAAKEAGQRCHQAPKQVSTRDAGGPR